MDERDRFTKTPVVYNVPGAADVIVRRDLPVPRPGGDPLLMDVYEPPDRDRRASVPALVIVAGYPDAGFERILGCRFKELAATTSWARLIASCGIAAITYANREPAADLGLLLDYVRRHAGALGIDPARVGLWASSGNAPLALSGLLHEPALPIVAAALCYPYTLDLDGSTAVADAARAFGFSNPCAGRTVADLRDDAPVFLVRAGRDETPRLNESLDRFVTAALGRNLPIALVNHPAGAHAFDLFQDSDDSRAVVRQVLEFLQAQLGKAPGSRL